MFRIIHILWVFLAALSMPGTTVHLPETSAFTQSQNLYSRNSSATQIATTVQTISPFSWEESGKEWAEEIEETEETKKPRKFSLLNWYAAVNKAFSPQIFGHPIPTNPGSCLPAMPTDRTTLHGVMRI